MSHRREIRIVCVCLILCLPALLWAQQSAVPSPDTAAQAASALPAPQKPIVPTATPTPEEAPGIAPTIALTPTPAHPISDLFIDPTATPTQTPTPTPPPEAFQTPVFSQTDATPTPTPPPVATPSPTTAPEPTSTPAPSPTPTAIPNEPLPTLMPAVDINSATEEQLASVPGLDAYRARLIVLHRQAVLGFQRLDQLRDVYGISEDIYQKIAPRLKVGPRSAFEKGTLQTEIPRAQPVLQTPAPPQPPLNPAIASPSPLPAATPAATSAQELSLPSVTP